MPQCPHCHKDIDTIYTSRTVNLKYKDGTWVEAQADRYCTYGCCECSEEFGDADLDKLGVPNDVR